MGNKERDILDGIAITKMMDNAVRPVALIGGTAALGLASYSLYKFLKTAYNWGEDALDFAKNTTGEVGAKYASSWAKARGNPLRWWMQLFDYEALSERIANQRAEQFGYDRPDKS